MHYLLGDPVLMDDSALRALLGNDLTKTSYETGVCKAWPLRRTALTAWSEDTRFVRPNGEGRFPVEKNALFVLIETVL